MKRIIACLSVVAALLACDFETSDNGDLDGMWLLVTVDTIRSGGHAYVVDTCYYTWAFQGKLLELRLLTDEREGESIMCNFDHTGDSLFVTALSVSRSGHQDTPLEVMQDIVRPYGLQRLEEHYLVQTLNSRRMVLKSGEVVLTLKKY